MSSFDTESFSGGNEHEEKFDPSDSWDIHVSNIGKSLQGVSEGASREEYFQEGETFVSGRQYEDGFGSWNPGKGDWIVERPETIVEFDENLLNGVYRAQLDFASVGQPDGPETPGHVWAVRLWDQKENKEIADTRIFSNKLSHGVSVAISKAPKWALEVWKTKEQIMNGHLQEEIMRTKHYFNDYSKHPFGEKMRKSLENSNSSYQEIAQLHSIDKWVELKIKEGVPTEEIIRTLIKMRNEFVDIGHKLSLEDRPYDDGYYSDDSHEGDGWMPPPDWKG